MRITTTPRTNTARMVAGLYVSPTLYGTHSLTNPTVLLLWKGQGFRIHMERCRPYRGGQAAGCSRRQLLELCGRESPAAGKQVLEQPVAASCQDRRPDLLEDRRFRHADCLGCESRSTPGTSLNAKNHHS
jgi:hypothetical protein